MSDRQLFSIYLFIGALRHDHPPLHDRVVVKRLEAEEKTASGIVLPGAAAEKPRHGRSDRRGCGQIGKDARAVRWMSKSATK